MKTRHLLIPFVLGLGLTLVLLWLLGGRPAVVVAAPARSEAEGLECRPLRAPGDVITVCPDSSCSYTTIQAAVDAANEGDVIKVATFTYHGVNVRPRDDVVTTGVVTQVVYISKTVTIRGGYTTANWDAPDPVANPTTVDSQGQGRGLYITGDISPTIEGLRITSGDAAGLGGYHPSLDWDVGGGVYIISATATISNCQVFSNTVDASGWDSGYGGGLYVTNSAATLSANTVASNTTSKHNGKGAGLYLNNSVATLTGNSINGNSTGSNGDGGGLYLSGGAPTLVGNTVISNTASRSGGGLELYNSAATISGNTITGNAAGRSGGGLYMSGSDDATLGDNTVISNTADRGGGLYLYNNDATLSGNAVISNRANSPTWQFGGGGGMYLDQSAATLDGNTITGNIATYCGGGVYQYNSDGATLRGNTISANTAITGGGGMYIAVSENATLDSNTISANSAITGGGLNIEWSEVTLTNNVIADNQAHAAGSGLYIRRCSSTLDDSVRLLHTTIARNSGGDGSGIYIAYSTSWPSYSIVELVNTILVSHTVGITVSAGSTATLNATLWHANSSGDTGGAGAVISSTNVTGDPDFADPDGRDYHVRENSAAQDAGVDAGVYTDIDGQGRPQGSGYDIGADEFHPMPNLAVTKQASADTVRAGGQLTYTIHVTNTGNVDLHATVTDTLPGHAMPTGLLTWPVTISAHGGVWVKTVIVTVETCYLGTLTNAVEVTTEEDATGADSITVSTIRQKIYLPLVLREFS